MNDVRGGADGAAVAGPRDVFISYAHEDRPKAIALSKALERRRLRVWWDPDLRAGDTWARVIEEAVEAAPCVVVLWSAEAVESRWVNAEARVGLDRDKLVPVCLDTAEPPLVFREIQWRSLVGWDGEGEPPGIDELVADIEAAIRRSRGGAATVRPDGVAPVRLPWRVLGALAAGVALGVAAVGLDGWGAALEGATDLVRRSGAPVPPVVTQAVALGLTALYLARQRRRAWPLRAASPGRVLTCSLALVLGPGVLYDWVQQTLGPKRDHLYGRIRATDLGGARVRAMDSLGREISAGGAPVDQEDGSFVLRFEPVLGDRPRWLEIQQPGCAPESRPIGRREWRSRRELEATFACRRLP
jgi:hypothetical protein